MTIKSGIQPPPQRRDTDKVLDSIAVPVRHPLTISWGDCDPAQIAYTANIPGWGLLGIEEWYRQCIGADWYALNLEFGIGTPFVALDFQFKSPVRPGAKLEVSVLVKRLGNSSLQHYIEGHQQQRLCFTGSTTAAFVSAKDMKPISIPPIMRRNIQRYMDLQDNDVND